MNQRFLGVLLAAVLAGAAWWIWDTTGDLSGPIASTFGEGGRPTGGMSASGYRWFMLLFTVALPVFVAWAVGGLPRLAPNHTNIPHREYWLAPRRRQQSLDFLSAAGLWLGLLMAWFGCALHGLILHANARRPPSLDMGLFWTVLFGLLAATGVWAWILIRRFRKPPRADGQDR